MSNVSYGSLEFLFHPRSIALAGITVANPEHWTRTFLEGLLEFKFEGPIYLVNPRGGEIKGLKVYHSFQDIPHTIDYVIGLVPARVAPALVKECAPKGVRAIHFGTAGFSETGEEEGVRLEAQLTEISRRKGIRLIGPNCMGIYCPQSHLSFGPVFPKESGPVGFISQSGGNARALAGEARWRGVRFSKVISYGNACDLNESDFLEYLAADSDTKIIALYIEGVKDGKRFREALSKATREKVVILLKGGATEEGARVASGHTGALAGSDAAWNSLCKQSGVIRVYSMDELADVLVTLLFIPSPGGRRVALVGTGGGASVLITDEFVKRGLEIPPLPQGIIDEIREFTPVAGNILQNPIDYSQTIMEIEKMVRTFNIISRWEGVDFLIGFLNLVWPQPSLRSQMDKLIAMMFEESRASSKPMALVLESGISPEQAKQLFVLTQKCVALGLPVYYSYATAANAINLVLSYNERRSGKPNT